MTSLDRDSLSSPQRQSPLAAVFLAIRALRQLGISQLVIGALLLANAPIPGGVFFAVPVFIVVVLGIGTVAWWRFTFCVVDDELRVTRGVLSHNTLTVPLDRVQSTSINQEFLHRLVGLVRVSVDTAGSSEAEFNIDAIDRALAESLQRVVSEHVATPTPADIVGVESGQPPPPSVPDVIVARRSLGDLVRVGVAQSPWTGLALIPPIAIVADDLGGTLGVSFPEFSEREFGVWIIWVAVLVFVVGTILGSLLQVVREIIANYDLTLTQTATGYRRTSGLFSKTSRASSLPRIIQLRTTQNLAQRRLGITNLTLPTIGSGDLVLVGSTTEEIEGVRNRVIDSDARVDTLDRRISPLAIFLAVRNAVVILLIGMAVGLVTIGWWGLAVWILLPVAVYTSRRSHRRTRWGVSEGGIALHDETFTAVRRDMALRRVQTATVRRSFFERRRGLATLHLAAAEGGVSIRLIPIEEAEALRDLTIGVVETDRRAWM
ncbi:MAG: PH domain-containing protein [Acidimicrobiales bacterium]